MNWHTIETNAALNELASSSETGLTSAQVEENKNKYGANELVERGGRTPWQILWEQITATMVLILIAAAVVAGILGDTKNTIAILSIVALYALLGFIQEYRAEQAIAALKTIVDHYILPPIANSTRRVTAPPPVPADPK